MLVQRLHLEKHSPNLAENLGNMLSFSNLFQFFTLWKFLTSLLDDIGDFLGLLSWNISWILLQPFGKQMITLPLPCAWPSVSYPCSSRAAKKTERGKVCPVPPHREEAASEWMGVPFLLHEDHLMSPTRSTFSFGSFSGLGEDRRGMEKWRLANHHFRWPQGPSKVGQSFFDLFRNLDLGLPGKSVLFPTV